MLVSEEVFYIFITKSQGDQLLVLSPSISTVFVISFVWFLSKPLPVYGGLGLMVSEGVVGGMVGLVFQSVTHREYLTQIIL